MAKPKKTRAELAAELRAIRTSERSDSLASVANNLIRWTGICVIAYFCYQSVASLAGETTTADIGVNLLASVKLSEVFAFLFGGGGVAYGWRQRALRKSTIERLQKRIKGLESEHDSRRSSSGLTPRGDTNPKDEV